MRLKANRLLKPVQSVIACNHNISTSVHDPHRGVISPSTIPRIIPPFPSLPHMKWVKVSLVPRPFPHPIFDHLQYAKTEEESLGNRVTYMTSGKHEGRCEGGST